MENNLLLHQLIVGATTILGERLRCRQPFVPTERKLFNELSELGIRSTQEIHYKWDAKYSIIRARLFIPRPSTRPLGVSLPKVALVRLNLLRTGVRRFQSSTHKWRLAPSSICVCGALDETTAHVILECLLYRAARGYHGMLVLNDRTRCWLYITVASI